MEGSSNASESEVVLLETLRRRGWFLGDLEQVKATIIIQSALADDSTKVLDAVESELLNLDLRSIGGKSLPDPSLVRKSSYLHGPKVLQIASVRDVSKSSLDDLSRNSGGRRLLRLCLTDGHSDITAIEYSHIPLISDNVVPGTKIRLENKAAIHSGIVCLNPTVFTVLGGIVQSLYEEWQMNQKYSGFSRSSLRKLEESGTGGPPPFVKLQVGSSSGYADTNFRSSKPNAVVGKTEMRPAGGQQYLDQRADNGINLKSVLPTERAEEKPSSSGTRLKEGYADSNFRSRKPNAVVGKNEMRPAGGQRYLDQRADNGINLKSIFPTDRAEEKPSSSGTRPKEDSNFRSCKPNALVGKNEMKPTGSQQYLDQRADSDINLKSILPTERTEEKPSSSGTRPKEVVESVPVQNQAAAQKLLQKMSHQNQDGWPRKGRKHRGKERPEDPVVFTLDEYENRKFEAKPPIKDGVPDISHDENLAWQLQNQLNLEYSHVQRGSHEAKAEDIRMSMFKYERDSDSSHQMAHGRRGRGGGRGRGRGRGRFS